ncbi:MAG TPA: bifunctional hydroxymethylpyrimidine kinase/phosphomethylpyrimidine kinase, partial [Abditibacteriaceae bacterium]|nr:bifunctional hydroxymethylpyrimidine kinase/phosphomethylpyrimidine kinase [Abditibacteriaceae bacterium]
MFLISPTISCVLSIGGLDPSGGAGLPADARAVRAFGAHSCAVATAVIAQNTRGVQHVEAVSAQMLRTQLDVLLDDIAPRGVKIGMIANGEQVQVLREMLDRWHDFPVVLDPVF